MLTNQLKSERSEAQRDRFFIRISTSIQGEGVGVAVVGRFEAHGPAFALING